jgi:centromeric protein E
MVVKGYEDNLGAPLRAVREDVEREWGARLAAEEAKRKEAEAFAAELARALEKEKKVCTVLPQASIHLSIHTFSAQPHHPSHPNLRVS